MTERKSFQCPNCGSPLVSNDAETEVKCPYCNSTVLVPQRLRDHLQSEQVDPDARSEAVSQNQVASDMKEINASLGGIAVDLKNIASELIFMAVNLKQIALSLRLRKIGVEARAKIQSAEDLHKRVLDSGWMYHFMFDVADPVTGEHFSSQCRGAIGDAAVPKYQVGKEAIVRYNPKHKEQLIIIRSAEN